MAAVSHKQVFDPVEHLHDHLSSGLRFDGRRPDEFRAVSLQTDLISTAHGSALVRVGDAVVVAAIKAEIVDQRAVSLESKLATGGCVSVTVEGENQSSRCASISSVLQNMLTSSGSFVDLPDLFIDRRLNIFWHLYVDLSILNCDGTSLDACLLALVAAFKTMHLPVATTVVRMDDEAGDFAVDEMTEIKDLNAVKIVVGPETRLLKFKTKTVPVVADFLILNRRDFDPCLDVESSGAKMLHSESDNFIVCDPTEKELCLFPDNTMSIILQSDPATGADPNVLAIFKPAGSTCLPQAILDKCFQLAVGRSAEIGKILKLHD